MSRDVEQLRLLSIFYFIFSGLAALGTIFGLFYVAVGLAMANGMPPGFQGGQPPQGPPPAAVGWILASIGGVVCVVSLLFSIGLLIAGLRLRQFRSAGFCMVMAGFICISVPFGTCLGVFTFIVLGRDFVKELFERRKRSIGVEEL